MINKNEIRLFLSSIGLIAVGCSATNKDKEVSVPEKPDIHFIFADDWGYGDLGCYGNNEVKKRSY
jgi:N-acetylgalactosamine-6-sulfatase